jgi:hypothetical protein
VARARAAAAARASVWPQSRSDDLAAAFERSATDALRAPVLAERSVMLRRVGKVVIPATLRPAARRAVKRVDAFSRALTDAIGRRR